jgi:hypothetical protein
VSKERKSSKDARQRDADTGSTDDQFIGRRELIAISKKQVGLRLRPEAKAASIGGADVSSLDDILTSEGIKLKPLFGAREDKLIAEAAFMAFTTGNMIPDLSVYYTVEAPDERLDQIAERLRQSKIMEGVYIKGPAETPKVELNNMSPTLED